MSGGHGIFTRHRSQSVCGEERAPHSDVENVTFNVLDNCANVPLGICLFQIFGADESRNWALCCVKCYHTLSREWPGSNIALNANYVASLHPRHIDVPILFHTRYGSP